METFGISSSTSPESQDSVSADFEPTDVEVERFVQDMLTFVETRKGELGEQAAIDAFLEVWRGSVTADKVPVEPTDLLSSAVIIPFPSDRAVSR